MTIFASKKKESSAVINLKRNSTSKSSGKIWYNLRIDGKDQGVFCVSEKSLNYPGALALYLGFITLKSNPIEVFRQLKKETGKSLFLLDVRDDTLGELDTIKKHIVFNTQYRSTSGRTLRIILLNFEGL